jgi:hypothetical protein
VVAVVVAVVVEGGGKKSQGESSQQAHIGRSEVLQQRAGTLLLGLGRLGGLALLLANHACESFIKDVLETLASESRAFEVLESVEFLDHVVGLLVGDGRLAVLAKGLEGRLVITKIGLGTDEDDWDIGAMVLDLDVPTILDVDERRMVDNREAQQEDIGLGVREGTNASITLLTSSIPKRELDLFAFYDNCSFIVVYKP